MQYTIASIIAQNTPVNLEKTKSVLEQIGDAMFNGRSLIILVSSLLVATVLGNVVAFLLRRLTRSVAKSADAATDLTTVNRLRRIETWIILLIAVVRLGILLFAIYFWWVYTHPGGKPSAIIGAGALTIVLAGAALTPLLRDFSFGAGMMAERWFGVGDLITVDFPRAQGVVERITLRSTKLRGLNGEVIWLSNQNINGVSVAQKGVWPMAIEMFVNNVDKAKQLVENTNILLPTGPSLVASELEVSSVSERAEGVWRLTVIGETPPGREWLLQDAAINIMKKLDSESTKPVLISDPLARFADSDTDKQFARTIRNAKKTSRRFIYRKKAGVQSASTQTSPNTGDVKTNSHGDSKRPGVNL